MPQPSQLVIASTYIELLLNHFSLVFLILGTIGFLGNCLIFLHPKVRTNTCSIYLLCSTISDELDLVLNLLPNYLSMCYTYALIFRNIKRNRQRVNITRSIRTNRHGIRAVVVQVLITNFLSIQWIILYSFVITSLQNTINISLEQFIIITFIFRLGYQIFFINSVKSFYIVKTKSSEYNFIRYLTTIQTNLYKIGGPILIIFGILSSILSLIIFMKKNLRKDPCSIYFIAYNIASLIMIYTVILLNTLIYGYNIDPSSYDIHFCRFRLYNLLLLDVLGPSYLILASIDRILITSMNVHIRQCSTIRLAYLTIFLTTIFWLLSTSHTWIFSSITMISPYINVCYFQMDNYYVFISYYSSIVKGILCASLMMIFGLWSIRNVRKSSHIYQMNAVLSRQSKDRQLLRILLNDIIIYFVFNSMLSIVLIYEQIVKSSSESISFNQLRVFYLIVGSFICYIPYCIGFYNNLFVSKKFRNLVKKTFFK
ncbi:unnamed protein product [Adineta ricciae]|uniref:G-protein coupled receptors family 1 profile domain-containing protein n=1 Tax=Adineta ricciae TaxID=249248 RepID=A0A815VQ04_ADIRI|nr:unnamed protein product [Adineta ricciae]